jgi:hypothetical protein
MKAGPNPGSQESFGRLLEKLTHGRQFSLVSDGMLALRGQYRLGGTWAISSATDPQED